MWKLDEKSGNIVHDSGHYFTIEGIRTKTNLGNISQWDQPIINQAEIGFLGIIVKKFNPVIGKSNSNLTSPDFDG